MLQLPSPQSLTTSSASPNKFGARPHLAAHVNGGRHESDGRQHVDDARPQGLRGLSAVAVGRPKTRQADSEDDDQAEVSRLTVGPSLGVRYDTCAYQDQGEENDADDEEADDHLGSG